MSLTINGASDDLIEIKGQISEEFNVLDNERGTLTLSNSAVIAYDLTNEDDGTWRFEVMEPAYGVYVDQARPDFDPPYSDRVVVNADIQWVRIDATGEKATA